MLNEQTTLQNNLQAIILNNNFNLNIHYLNTVTFYILKVFIFIFSSMVCLLSSIASYRVIYPFCYILFKMKVFLGIQTKKYLNLKYLSSSLNYDITSESSSMTELLLE